MIKAIHIPTAISFDIPDVYGVTDADVDLYLEWFSWCKVCQDKGIRFMLAYSNCTKEERKDLFQYNRYEYMIIREDENA